MGSLGHVFWQAQVLPQRHPQLARPFCTCRLSAGQAAAPRGNRLLLRAISAIPWPMVGKLRNVWQVAITCLGNVWQSHSRGALILTGHKARNECPTMKQMGNRANKEVAGDESRCVLKMRLAGERSNLRFGSGGALPYLLSGSVVWDRVLMCVQQLVSYIRVPIWTRAGVVDNKLFVRLNGF